MIDIDMEYEKELYNKLQSLKPLSKAGVIEILYRLAKEDTLISILYRKYNMHPESVHNAVKLLEELDWIQIKKEGRKKILVLSDKGRKIVTNLDSILNITK